MSLLFCAWATAAAVPAGALGASPSDWPLVSGDTTNQRYSTLKHIDLANVSGLQGAWKSEPFPDGATSRSTPVIHAGLMIVNAGTKVFALDAANGRVVWSWLSDDRHIEDMLLAQRSGFATPNSQGVAIGDGAVFVGLMDGQVAALNERTGKLLWRRQVGETPRKIGQAVSAAPTFCDGTLFVGIANGDYALRGRIVALDAKTGTERWHFTTVPSPGEDGFDTWDQKNNIWELGGGGVWQVGTVDRELGTIYFAVGNTTPVWGGELRPGDNLYTSSVIALDMKTGRKRWHFQAIHHDLWDADVATAPLLYDYKSQGKTSKAIALLRSDGYLFVLDRASGKPLVPIEERPVPQSQASRSSATQPFPTRGESLLPDCRFWKDKIPSGFVCGEAFTPPSMPAPSSDPQNVLAPMWGVRNTPLSYSPQAGLIFARGIATLDWRRRTEDPWYWGFMGFVPDQQTHGFLAAFDSTTSKIVWKKQVPPDTLGGGGSLVTAGGLMFRLGGDGQFTAYKAQSGDVVWQFQTGYRGGSGSPASYEIKGEQYIAVPVGPVVWGFKLNGSLHEAATSEKVRSLYGEYAPGGAVQLTDHVETTKVQTDLSNLGGPHYYVDPYSFDPPRARIKAGTSLTFSNRGVDVYTVVATDGSWTTGPILPTEYRSVSFDKPGLYTYVTKERPFSYGQIVVVGEETAKNGVYSEAQAARGQSAYALNCASCHLDTLQGNGQAPALMGSVFASHWGNRSFEELYQRLSSTMPQRAPGSLAENVYFDILSYLLQANNLPPGPQPLTKDSNKLKTVIGDSRSQ